MSNLGDLTRNEVYCVILRRDYHIFLTVLNTFNKYNTMQYILNTDPVLDPMGSLQQVDATWALIVS